MFLGWLGFSAEDEINRDRAKLEEKKRLSFILKRIMGLKQMFVGKDEMHNIY